MKGLKYVIGCLCMAMVMTGCGDNMTNKKKGALIGTAAGGAGGAGLGAAFGALIGGKKGAKIGAGIGAGAGVAAGATAGTLIGKKMDNAAAAAAAVEAAEVEKVTDANGLAAVKVSFDNGILFAVGKNELRPAAQKSLRQFATNVLNVYTDCDVAIAGFASSDGSESTNLALSQRRAYAVSSFLKNSCNVNPNQIKEVVGHGEDPEYLVYNADGTENREASRRVEVYLYASEAMINAANAGTLE